MKILLSEPYLISVKVWLYTYVPWAGAKSKCDLDLFDCLNRGFHTSGTSSQIIIINLKMQINHTYGNQGF